MIASLWDVNSNLHWYKSVLDWTGLDTKAYVIKDFYIHF